MIFYGFAFPWNIFVLYERKNFSAGRILDFETKNPIAKVSLQIFSKETKPVTSISDQNGQIRFDVKPGRYNFKIVSSGVTFKEDVLALPVEINNDGYLEKNLYLKLRDENTQDSSNLTNPFD